VQARRSQTGNAARQVARHKLDVTHTGATGLRLALTPAAIADVARRSWRWREAGWPRVGRRGSDAWADAVRVVVRRSFGRSA
jgi:hypothetical protein